jgi:predicted ArsR family transcriptional regulator
MGIAALYAFIRRARGPVTRDEAATAAGISRKLAAFHLDKLVEAGFLRARIEPVGRFHMGARASKVYEPVRAEFRVSIPPRQHDLLADILLDAVLTAGENDTPRQSALRTARDRGRTLGAAERSGARQGELAAQDALAHAERVLERHGFEPVRDTAAHLCLRNCPFHPFATQSPTLVCAVNHALLQGFLDGLRAPGVEAIFAQRSGECCVQLRRTTTP